MTERLVIAAIVVVSLWLAGRLVRSWSTQRSARIAKNRSLEQDPTALPQLLTFVGPSCDACEKQKRIIDDLRLAETRRATVRFVDAVTHADYARHFGVLMVPTTVVAAADGSILEIVTGVVSSDRLADLLHRAA